MSLLKLPRYYNQVNRTTSVAPFNDVEIDYSHPLTRGLVSAVKGTQDLVSGKDIINDLPVEVTADGEMYGYHAGNQLICTFPTNKSEMTMISRVRSINSNLSGFIDLFSTALDGDIYSRIRTAGTTTINSIVETTGFGFGILTTTEVEKSFNVVLKGGSTTCSGITNSETWSSTGTGLAPWNEIRVVGGTFTGSELYAPYLYVWDVELTRDECEHLYRNPYEILKPTRNRVYFTAGVVGPGTSEGDFNSTSADTLSATGTVLAPVYEGEFNSTSADTLTATGTVLAPVYEGELSSTASDTLTATGTVLAPTYDGEFDSTASDTLSATGTVIAPTINNGDFSSTSSDTLTATGTVILPNVTVANFNSTSNDILVAAGTVIAPAVSGNFSGTITNTLVATGTVGLIYADDNDISLTIDFNFNDINFTVEL